MVHSQANFVCYISRAWKMINLNGQVNKRHVTVKQYTNTKNSSEYTYKFAYCYIYMLKIEKNYTTRK